MRKGTLKKGVNLLNAGLVAVILATFYHTGIAWLFRLSPAGETQLIFFGLFWGGVLGGAGIMVVLFGLLRQSVPGERTRLTPAVALLAVLAVFFLALWFFSSTTSIQPRLSPGETITI